MVLESKINQFVSKISLGVEFFQEAGVMLVEMLDEDPRIFEEIMEVTREKWITMDVLSCFEMIGRKQLAVEAMFLPRHVLNRMLEWPVDKQAALAKDSVAVVTGTKHGRHWATTKPAAKLTRTEAERVIGPKGVRSVKEQAAMLYSQTKFESCGLFDIYTDKDKTIKMIPSILKSKLPACQSVRLTSGVAQIELVRALQANIPDDQTQK
jgi:hypothetical protein